MTICWCCFKWNWSAKSKNYSLPFLVCLVFCSCQTNYWHSQKLSNRILRGKIQAFCTVRYKHTHTHARTHMHRLNLKIQSYSSIKRHSPCLPSANEQPNIEMLYEHIVHLLLFAAVRKKTSITHIRNTQFCIYKRACAHAYENNNNKMYKQQWHLLRICWCTRFGGEICKSILILIQTRTNFIILFLVLLFRPFVWFALYACVCVCARPCGRDFFFLHLFAVCILVVTQCVHVTFKCNIM